MVSSVMALADEYARQAAWRDWRPVLHALPDLDGRSVLDLGCAIGDQAAALAARGARVTGVDANPELLAVARARGLTNVVLERADLRALPDLGGSFDGIWCSFAAAYFPALAPVLASWRPWLRPGGWVALTEVDDLFGHEPLPADVAALLGGYADEASAAGRYDFRMGARLAGELERAGFTVQRELLLPDAELSFDGPAPPEVLAAWRARLERMTPLHAFCGARWERVRSTFCACLAALDHVPRCRVRCVLARRPPAGAACREGRVLQGRER